MIEIDLQQLNRITIHDEVSHNTQCIILESIR